MIMCEHCSQLMNGVILVLGWQLVQCRRAAQPADARTAQFMRQTNRDGAARDRVSRTLNSKLTGCARLTALNRRYVPFYKEFSIYQHYIQFYILLSYSTKN